MWEEPRPERLRDRDSVRNRDVGKSVLAWAIIASAAVILLKTGVIDLGRKDRSDPPPAPAEHTRPAPTGPETTQPQWSNGQRIAPDPGATLPTQRSDSRPSTARGDPNVMRTLTDTCRYWVQQNTQRQYSGNQEIACRDMAAYAREHGFPVPTISGRGPSIPSAPRENYTQSRPTIYVHECDRNSYGSIAYRQCRANEKRRLSNECQRLRDQLEYATGPGRPQLLARTSETCAAADRYRTVQ
jgi:hypothetical protein